MADAISFCKFIQRFYVPAVRYMAHGRRAGPSLSVVFFSIFSSRVINYKFSFLFSSGMVILQPQAAALNPHGHGMPRGIFPRIAQRVFLELMEKIKTFFFGARASKTD